MIFVGRVVVDSGEGLGERPARVEVEEVLKGLSSDIKEVDVNSSYGNSCYYHLKENERYVIFANQALATGACTVTFNVKGKEHVLAALRNALSGGPPRLVGTVIRASGRFAHDGVVPSAVVSLDGEKQSVNSDGQGNYEFDALLPGRYRISVSHPGFLPDDDFNNRWSGGTKLAGNVVKPDDSPRGTVLIEEKSCEVWDLGLWPDGHIKGTVKDKTGLPLSGVKVQAFGMDRARNEFESEPLREAVTDSQGHYTVDRLPPGPYMIGVNAKNYSDDNAYPPTFYPSTTDRHGAGSVPVGEAQEVGAIDLTIPPPRQTIPIDIRVVDENGRPLQGAAVFLVNRAGDDRSKSKQSDLNGEVILIGYKGEDYMVRGAYSRGRQFLSGKASVDPNKSGLQLLTLGPQ